MSRSEAAFKVTDPKLFNEDQVKSAFAAERFNDVTVVKKPG